MNSNGVSGGVYGLAFLGALVYYFQHAATLWAGVLGFFKALLACISDLQAVRVSKNVELPNFRISEQSKPLLISNMNCTQSTQSGAYQ